MERTAFVTWLAKGEPATDRRTTFSTYRTNLYMTKDNKIMELITEAKLTCPECGYVEMLDIPPNY